MVYNSFSSRRRLAAEACLPCCGKSLSHLPRKLAGEKERGASLAYSCCPFFLFSAGYISGKATFLGGG